MSASATVLVVEDDAAIRRGLVDALKFGGYAVHEAAEGRAGLQMALSLAIDLALLDVVLPGIDGFELLESVRRSKPTLPVILVTARGAESDRVRNDMYVIARQLWPTQFPKKPLPPDDVEGRRDCIRKVKRGSNTNG